MNAIPGSYPRVQGKYGDDSEQWIIEESFGVRMAPAPSNLIIINDDSDEEDKCPEIPKINHQTSPTGLTFPAAPLDLNLTPQENQVLILPSAPPRPSLVARTGGQSLPRVRFSDNDNVRVPSAEPEIVTDGIRDLEIDETEDN